MVPPKDLLVVVAAGGGGGRAKFVTTDLWLGCCASRRLAMTSGLKAAALL